MGRGGTLDPQPPMADDGRRSICQRRQALGGRRRDEQWRRVGGGAIGSERRQRDWGNGEPGTLTTESGAGRSLQLGRTRPGWDGAKYGSGAPDVQNKVFSLQNRVQLGCGAHWQYFQKPECLTTKDEKRSVRQQRCVIWHVQ